MLCCASMGGLRRLAFRAVYVLGVAAFLEGSSRVALSVDSMRARILANDESSFRLAWIHRGRVPGIAYAFDLYHPVRGWALAPFLHEADVFGGKVLTSNSRGIRGSSEHAEKASGRRILVFGDSFTFGEEVSDDETYAAALGRALPDADVLNMGVHGYGHDQMLLYLREEGHNYHPDLVLLGFLPYDMERNLLQFRDFAKPRFAVEQRRLVLRGTPVPTPEAVRAQEVYRSEFIDLLRILWSRALGSDERVVKELTSLVLDSFRDSARSVGAECLLAYLPVWHEMDLPGDSLAEGEKFFLDYCQARNAHCVDLRPLFLERERKGDHFKTSGHWNRREHQAAAEFLAPEVRRLLGSSSQ